MTKRVKKIICLLLIVTIVSSAIFLFKGLTPENFDFFFGRRLSKIIAICVAAICVAYSSVTFQTVTNNNILTPSVIGLESLYMFVQTLIVFKWGSGELQAMTDIGNYFLSLFVMVIFSTILFYFMIRVFHSNIYKLILLGIVIGSFFGGLSTFMQVLLDPNEFLILQNSMFADFNNINTDLLSISILIIACIFIFVFKDIPIYDVMSLGRNQSVNLGINYNRFTAKSLIITSILIAVSTALVGPLTFLGIILVSLSRYLANTYRHIPRIILAILIGTSSLLVGQLLVENVFNFDITISVIINFVGGIYFIFLVLKEARR